RHLSSTFRLWLGRHGRASAGRARLGGAPRCGLAAPELLLIAREPLKDLCLAVSRAFAPALVDLERVTEERLRSLELALSRIRLAEPRDGVRLPDDVAAVGKVRAGHRVRFDGRVVVAAHEAAVADADQRLCSERHVSVIESELEAARVRGGRLGDRQALIEVAPES